MNATRDTRLGRLAAVRRLVEEGSYASQSEIVGALAVEHGIEAHQSTVSRDLTELGILLVVDGDGVAYRLPGDVVSRLGDARSIPLIVVASSAGRASLLAGQLRRGPQPHVPGDA
jgi:transcriptional regulator of arginine metabolism